MTINWIQIGMAVAFMIVLVCVGLYMRKKVKNSTDYWIGGRQVGPVTTAISYCAAYYSTVAIVGGPSMYYIYGMGYAGLEALLNIALTGFVLFIVFAPKIRAVSERVDAVSLSGLLAIRYSSNKIRLISASIISVMVIPYAIACVKGIADTLNAIAGIPYVVGVIIVVIVSFAYLITSGYWGVATVDIIQGITITLAIVVTAVAVLKTAGGLTPIVEYIVREQPVKASITGGLNWLTFFSYSGICAFLAFGQPQLTTKFMALKDSRTVSTVIRVSLIWQIIFYIATSVIGLGAVYLFKGAVFENIDLIAPTTAAAYGGITSGIFLCGALAAGFSTVAALVLTSSAAVGKDIYEDYMSNRRNVEFDANRSIKISRVITGITIILILVGALYPMDFVWSLSTMSAGIMGAAFTAPIIMGLYWRRATTSACYAAMAGGSIVSMCWYMAGLSNIVHSFIPGVAVSFALMIIVSLATKPMKSGHLDVFFDTDCSEDKIAAAILNAKK